MMTLIDTHAHVYNLRFEEGDSLDQLVRRSRDVGVKAVYMPNLNMETLPRMLKVETCFPDFFKCMIGLHPCEVKDDFEKDLASIKGSLNEDSFVAIGEVGIDLYHSRKYERQQMIAFEEQVKWARCCKLPLVVHCRGAFDVLLERLESLQDGRLKGVIHCFTGTVAQARKCIELGFYLGIGGIVTYKNRDLERVVKEVSLDNIVLETDSPYLAPVPKRGRHNEPSYLPYIAAKIAEIKSIRVDQVAQITTANALQLFESRT